MIDFACKKFDLGEIIRCSLSLTKLEFRIFEYLIRNNESWLSTRDISKKLAIGLSTAQKAMKKLNEKGMTDQRQQNIDGGGYLYVYHILDKPTLRKTILEIVQNWTRKVEIEINNW